MIIVEEVNLEYNIVAKRLKLGPRSKRASSQIGIAYVEFVSKDVSLYSMLLGNTNHVSNKVH